MVLIFDLDDTLYDEITFVRSGLRAVAQYGMDTFGWPVDESFQLMNTVLKQEGRGYVFDRWLASHGQTSKALIARCVHIYRHHIPILQLAPAAQAILTHYQGVSPLYLVTDGHKIVQRNKVDALNLWPQFRRVLITHRFGIQHAKPSTHCFELIRQAEKCRWDEMVYVGDNPAKDFVNLTPLGVLTIRVLTGEHRNVSAKANHNAKVTIPDLTALPEVLSKYFYS